MLKEERKLKAYVRVHVPKNRMIQVTILDGIAALVRAVREDCAKVADGFGSIYKSMEEKDKRKGKDPDKIDMVRRFACEDIAAAIRRRK